MRKSRRRLAFAAIVWVLPTVAFAAKADHVVVEKSKSMLHLERAGQRFASFKVAFGGEPKGHKQQEGDERTPEGRYALDSKNSNSAFYKAIHVSYPNAKDKAAAKSRGVSPGGLIMIHGQRNGLGWLAPIAQLFDWTDGCIALNNSDMDTVWNSVEVGTTIEIDP